MGSRAIVALGLASVAATAARGVEVTREAAAEAYVQYFEAMSVLEPFEVRTGAALSAHHDALRRRLLRDVGLDPLPERVPLDVHKAEPIDHPWCTVTKLVYQLWPGVYLRGVLYMPKEFEETPAPTILSPHGHWGNGYAHAEVQKRCLMLAKLGYVTFCPEQTHMEDPNIGFSHQTLMVWGNMRALDLLQSLPEVDGGRIGVCGTSGGGLQTQMILALDPERVKAAMIGGMTCEMREILFPHSAHCGCNHFPNVMRYTDHPEISAMGFPAAVGYLTMWDWTEPFRYADYPMVQATYVQNGKPENVYCGFWPTPHLYDRTKRETTYWWMERHVRGIERAGMPEEPESIQTVWPDEVLAQLKVEVPGEVGIGHAPELYREQFMYAVPELKSKADWDTYSAKMASALPDLLGMAEELPTGDFGSLQETESGVESSHRFIRGTVQSEGPFAIPVVAIMGREEPGVPGVRIYLRPKGATADVQAHASDGGLAVLADVRYTGVYAPESLAGAVRPDLRRLKPASDAGLSQTPEDREKLLYWSAERNSIVWGRPVIGQIVTDIRAVVDAVNARVPEAPITLVTADAGYLAAAAIFAAVLDGRISGLDVDLNGSSFAQNTAWMDARDKLAVVPFILRYGDLAQWAAVVGGQGSRVVWSTGKCGPPLAGGSLCGGRRWRRVGGMTGSNRRPRPGKHSPGRSRRTRRGSNTDGVQFVLILRSTFPSYIQTFFSSEDRCTPPIHSSIGLVGNAEARPSRTA